jgi:hypothetical protein
MPTQYSNQISIDIAPIVSNQAAMTLPETIHKKTAFLV